MWRASAGGKRSCRGNTAARRVPATESQRHGHKTSWVPWFCASVAPLFRASAFLRHRVRFFADLLRGRAGIRGGGNRPADDEIISARLERRGRRQCAGLVVGNGRVRETDSGRHDDEPVAAGASEIRDFERRGYDAVETRILREPGETNDLLTDWRVHPDLTQRLPVETGEHGHSNHQRAV